MGVLPSARFLLKLAFDFSSRKLYSMNDTDFKGQILYYVHIQKIFLGRTSWVTLQ